MITSTIKKAEDAPHEADMEEGFSDQLDIAKFLGSVHSTPLSEDVKQDFTLAKLNEKDRKFIAEMTSNAFYAKQTIASIARNAKNLTDEQKKHILKTAANTFTTYMTRIQMIAILNRNVSDNHLVKILAGVSETQTETKEEETKQKNLITKLFGSQEKKKQEEKT